MNWCPSQSYLGSSMEVGIAQKGSKMYSLGWALQESDSLVFTKMPYITTYFFFFFMLFEPFCGRSWMGTWRRCPVVAGVIESEVDQHNTGQMASAMSGVAPPWSSPGTQSPIRRVKQGWVLVRNMVFWEDFASEFCLAPHYCDMFVFYKPACMFFIKWCLPFL